MGFKKITVHQRGATGVPSGPATVQKPLSAFDILTDLQSGFWETSHKKER